LEYDSSAIGNRAENQDAFRYGEMKEGLLAVVCDGMGGAAGGKEAAELAVNNIFNEIEQNSAKDPLDKIKQAVTKANLSIYKHSIKNPWLSGMGTTITALFINEENAFCFHVGDSRIYHLRNGKIIYRTFDHSRVFEMVNLGLLTEEEARVSPMSNIITKVLGTEPYVDLTTSPALAYENNDRFLLCTDGIWNALPENELIKLVSQPNPVDEVVNKMTTDISYLGKEEGIRLDNMTAVLIEVYK
jgi:protein phosphatase